MISEARSEATLHAPTTFNRGSSAPRSDTDHNVVRPVAMLRSLQFLLCSLSSQLNTSKVKQCEV